MKIRIWLIASILLLAGTAGFVAGRYFSDNRKPNFSEKYVLYVHPEMTVDQIKDSLAVRAGVIRPRSIDRTFKKMEVASTLCILQLF